MKSIIDEQLQKIRLLEDREHDYQDELKRREELILDLQNQIMVTQNHLDAATKDLQIFAELVDVAHAELAKETDKLQTFFSESRKTIYSLHQAYLESNQVTDSMNMKYFSALDISTASSNLPTVCIRKFTCQHFPSPSVDGMSYMNPYIAISLKDGGTQTGPIVGAKPGATIEWAPVNEMCVRSCISPGDLISVEVWNQYTHYEAHLVAKAQGRVVPQEHEAAWREGNDCECEILLSFVDENSNRLEGTVTLTYNLKNNLYCANTTSFDHILQQPQDIEYVDTQRPELAIPSTCHEKVVTLNSFVNLI